MLKCPNCGHDGPFSVLAEYRISLDKNGEDFETPPNDSVVWGKDSKCCCPKCSLNRKLGDFEKEQHLMEVAHVEMP